MPYGQANSILTKNFLGLCKRTTQNRLAPLKPRDIVAFARRIFGQKMEVNIATEILGRFRPNNIQDRSILNLFSLSLRALNTGELRLGSVGELLDLCIKERSTFAFGNVVNNVNGLGTRFCATLGDTFLTYGQAKRKWQEAQKIRQEILRDIENLRQSSAPEAENEEKLPSAFGNDRVLTELNAEQLARQRSAGDLQRQLEDSEEAARALYRRMPKNLQAELRLGAIGLDYYSPG